MSALLEVEDLCVQFGEVHAVEGASFAVDSGGTLAVIGEQGSGKTVISLAMLGLRPGPDMQISGRIVFEGRDLIQASERELRRLRGNEIALVSPLHPLHTIGWQLGEAIRIHRRVSKAAARDRAIDLLEAVGIAEPHERIDHYPHELPGGWRLRAAIAMAVANEPQLLIADEPRTALDWVQPHILNLLKELQRRMGMAMIVLTRDHDVATRVADAIYRLPIPPRTAIPAPAPDREQTTA